MYENYCLRISLQQQLEHMIRKFTKNDMQTTKNHKKIQIHSYRNALYHGEFNETDSKRQGKGIVYITDTHHFVATDQFKSNKLNGNCFFFHQHANYMYGPWRHNKPHGINIVRMGQVLFIAEFRQGKIAENKKSLVIFQKINTGIIFQEQKQGKRQIIAKQDVLNSSDLMRMVNDCHFKGQSTFLHHSLIKYLNKVMSSQRKQEPKLRLINNSHYRFGYDIGLAVIFDDQFKILSAGMHHKNALSSFGVKFHGLNLGHRVQQGLFDGYNTFTYDLKSKPEQRIKQRYIKLHLTELNFKNQYFKDPSIAYFNYFSETINDQTIKSIYQKQVLSSSRKMVTSFSILKDNENEYQTKKQRPFQKLNADSISLPHLKKSPIEIQGEKLSKGIQSLYKYDPRQNSKHIYTVDFESMNENLRLQVLKKQLYENVNHKVKLKEDEDKQNSYKAQRIISKSPVKLKLVQDKNVQTQQQLLDFKDIGMKKNKDQPYPNLSRKVDIYIKNQPQVQSSVSRKSKKKIFEDYQNIKRDYSPETQVSPFKSRMKSRIFKKTPSRQNRSRSRSPNRIFGGTSYTPQKRQTGKFYASKSQNQLLMKSQNEMFMKQRSESSSEIKMYPVTLEKINRVQKPLGRQISSSFYEQNKQRIKKNQKTNIEEYLIANDNKSLKDQMNKKSNTVYKNQMKTQYGNYVYQPINIKSGGNSPYIQNKQPLSRNVSNATLAHNPSQTTIRRQMSKKSIEDTSPNKKQKMGVYMGQSFGLREAERLSDFKRRVNYF